MRDTVAGTVMFLPSTSAERGALERIAATPVGTRLKYAGYDEPAPNNLELSFRVDDPTSGFELVVRGSAEDDRKAIGALRDALFYGSGELIFLGATSGNGAPTAVLTAAYCKLCGMTMIDRISCEWSTCNGCAARCAHEYERGAVHGGEALLEVDEYCGHCGRMKSSELPSRPAGSLVQEAEQELGVIVLENASLHEIGQHLRALTEEPS